MLSYLNHMSNTEAPRPNLAEAPTTQFLVHYRLSGAMLVRSTSGQAASQAVAVSLEALFGNREAGEAWPSEASRIRVSELAVNVDAVEAIEFTADEGLPPVPDVILDEVIQPRASTPAE
jgi:hypothetical protein